MTELPQGWTLVPIKDVATLLRKKPSHLKESDDVVSFVPMAEVEELTGVVNTANTISHKTALAKTLTYFQENDVLFAKVTPCMENGKIAIAKNLIDGQGYGSTEFHVITCGPRLKNKFLLYFLLNEDFRIEAERSMRGAVGLRRVPREYIEDFEIPLPPMDVQDELVEFMESNFARIDKSNHDLKLATRGVNALKSSILHSVFSGALSDESIDFNSFTLAEVAKWGSGGTPKAGTAAFYGGDIPWAVIGDLNDGDVFSTEKTITQLGLESSSAKLVDVGTILIAMYGSIGKMGIARVPMATNQAIAFAVPNETLITSGYLYWYLVSQREVFLASGKGAAQQNISQTILKEWPIAVPPLEEQNRLVELIEDRLSAASKILEIEDQSTKQLSLLKRSLLRDVYTGRKTNGSANE